jgi:hypothetical protein
MTTGVFVMTTGVFVITTGVFVITTGVFVILIRITRIRNLYFLLVIYSS